MRKKFLSILTTLGITITSSSLASEDLTVQSNPVGILEVSAASGTGSSKATTLISAPLLRTGNKTGQMSGAITGIEASRLIVANAGWQPSEITSPSQPHAIMITSGAAEGRMFMAVAHADNSASALQVSDPHNRDSNLTALGIQPDSDTYQIFELDTIKSLFGEPDPNNPSSVKCGPNAQQADVVTITQNGSVSSYFFNTTLQRWTAIKLGSPDGSNTPLMPYYGIQYARLSTSPLKIILSGEVPRLERQMTLPAHGATLLASYWPVAQRLSQTGLSGRPEWRQGTPPNTDRVTLTSSLGSATYYHDGQNWRRLGLGAPISDDTLIGVGSALLIHRPRAGTPLALTQGMPYSL